MKFLKDFFKKMRQAFYPDYIQRVVLLIDVQQSANALSLYMNDPAFFADEQRPLGNVPDGVLDFAGGNRPRDSLVFYVDSRVVQQNQLTDWLNKKGIIALSDSRTK